MTAYVRVDLIASGQLITLAEAQAMVVAAREAAAVIGFNAVNECRENEETDLRSVREHVAAAIRAAATATKEGE